jgi:dUTP pyrophosphatase
MSKIYKSLFSTILYIAAIIAIIYALFTDFTVSVWAVAVFLLAVFVVTAIKTYGKPVKVKYFVPGLAPIQKISVGDWIDLRAGETVSIKKGDYYLIRLGVGMILPEGYEALVLPRSSTPYKFGIMVANSMGVIDNSYCGDADEWKFPAVALRDTVIHKGDRIAQFRIMENQPRLRFETVSNLKANSRGGIGSTGKR